MNIDAAISRTRASRPVVSAVIAVMKDGAERTDEEITKLVNYVYSTSFKRDWSQDAVRHARLALEMAGLLKYTGKRRRTKNGGTASVWKAKMKGK